MSKMYIQKVIMEYKLSIIITFYRGEKFLPILLDSLISSYSGSKKMINLELILIVDSPETNIFVLQELLNNYSFLNINLSVNEKNIGVAKSRDLGIRLAKGEYITFIDQDDNVNLPYFCVLENELIKDIDLFIQNGYVKNIISNKKVSIFYYKPKIGLEEFILDNKILTPSLIVVKKEIVVINNIRFTLPFDEYKGIDDWFFILQILIRIQNIKYKWIDERNVNYCIHDANYSNDIFESINGSIEVLKYVKNEIPNYSSLINSRIKVLEFSKKFYSDQRIESVILQPGLFIKFIYQYLQDVNRVIRITHRLILGLKIR
jgi:glycosyltransferase involved in cell wall biosynthesis